MPSSLLLDSGIVIKEDAGDQSERDREDEGEDIAENAPPPISTAHQQSMTVQLLFRTFLIPNVAMPMLKCLFCLKVRKCMSSSC